MKLFKLIALTLLLAIAGAASSGAASALPAGAPLSTAAPAAPFPPGGGATVYATAPEILGLTAVGGWTAWSAKQANGRWQLQLRSPGGAITAPLGADRAIPYDANLGIGPAGHLQLAYSRCTREPMLADPVHDLTWFRSRGCRIHILDLASRADRTLALAPGSLSDMLPSTSGARIVAASILRAGKRFAIVVRKGTGRGRVRFTGRAGLRHGFLLGPQFTAVNKKRIAFTTLETSRPALETFTTKVHLLGAAGKPRTIDREGGPGIGTCIGFTDIYSLSFDQNSVIASLGSPVGWAALRLPAGRGPRTYAPGQSFDGQSPSVYVPQVVIDGPREVATPAGPAGVSVIAFKPPAFGSRQPLNNPDQCAG